MDDIARGFASAAMDGDMSCVDKAIEGSLNGAFSKSGPRSQYAHRRPATFSHPFIVNLIRKCDQHELGSRVRIGLKRQVEQSVAH